MSECRIQSAGSKLALFVRRRCVAKAGKQNLSKNRKSDTGPASLTPVPDTGPACIDHAGRVARIPKILEKAIALIAT